MILIAVVFDLIGYFTKSPRLYEVSWWNLVFATVSIFIAVIFGQIEAGLAEPYAAAADTLNQHSLIGWSLAGLVAGVTGWRYVIRSRQQQQLSKGYLLVSVLLLGLVLWQSYLGTLLVWVYGLHSIPVVDAIREGGLS